MILPCRVVVTGGPYRECTGAAIRSYRGKIGEKWKITLVNLDDGRQRWIERRHLKPEDPKKC